MAWYQMTFVSLTWEFRTAKVRYTTLLVQDILSH